MDKDTILQQIDKNVVNCKKCRLHQFAKNAVPGEGNINADIVFIGEAPGATEDATGRPFVGRAGKLLEKLLAEIGYKREDVWIGNIIKHRPPNNRDPFVDEISACEPYLSMQLKAMRPKIVVTLGRFAMYYFYKDGKISRDHGNVIRVRDLLVYPIYHPAAALRNPGFEDALRADFKKIPNILAKIEEDKLDDLQAPVSEEESEGGQLGLGI